MCKWISVKDYTPKVSGLYDVIIDREKHMAFCNVTESGCEWDTASVTFWKPHEQIEYDFKKY